MCRRAGAAGRRRSEFGYELDGIQTRTGGPREGGRSRASAVLAVMSSKAARACLSHAIGSTRADAIGPGTEPQPVHLPNTHSTQPEPSSSPDRAGAFAASAGTSTMRSPWAVHNRTRRTPDAFESGANQAGSAGTACSRRASARQRPTRRKRASPPRDSFIDNCGCRACIFFRLPAVSPLHGSTVLNPGIIHQPDNDSQRTLRPSGLQRPGGYRRRFTESSTCGLTTLIGAPSAKATI